MKTFGFFKEYYTEQGKLLGLVNFVDKDRETFGWFGQETSILDCDVKLHNKRTIKKGTKVKTQLHILCGRIK